jgi:hypothetical protein
MGSLPAEARKCKPQVRNRLGELRAVEGLKLVSDEGWGLVALIAQKTKKKRSFWQKVKVVDRKKE